MQVRQDQSSEKVATPQTANSTPFMTPPNSLQNSSSPYAERLNGRTAATAKHQFENSTPASPLSPTQSNHSLPVHRAKLDLEDLSPRNGRPIEDYHPEEWSVQIVERQLGSGVDLVPATSVSGPVPIILLKIQVQHNSVHSQKKDPIVMSIMISRNDDPTSLAERALLKQNLPKQLLPRIAQPITFSLVRTL